MEDLEVLYEDNQVIVVKKPQNVPSQADESGDPDMLTMVKEYVKVKYNKPGEAFIGLVHRLDRPTGGIMVFARNSKAASRLGEQIQNGEFEKTYFAVVKGNLPASHGTLINYLKKDEKDNMVKIVPQSSEGAKKAELEYYLLEKKGEFNLVQVKLKTGRGHQIRVQFANIKCPVFGDRKYGGKDMPKANINLFATILKFTHPTNKNRLTFRCFPPEDLNAWNKFNLEKYLNLNINN